MPEVEKSQSWSNYHTDTLLDLMDLQDRACSEMAALADASRKRSRMIRAHVAAHAREIDFARVFTGERRGGA